MYIRPWAADETSIDGTFKILCAGTENRLLDVVGETLKAEGVSAW
jgi:hypothetical protein